MWGKFEEKHLGLSKRDCQILKVFSILGALIMLSLNPIRLLVYRLPLDEIYFSIGIAFFSIAIAFHACLISIESDEKMKSVSNAQFLSVISKFEDRRIDMKFNLHYLHIGLWKALVDMDEAVELNSSENINRGYLRTLTSRYDVLMDLVVLPNNKELFCEDIRHILKMYKYVLDFIIKDNLKNASRGYINELFGFNEGAEVTIDYVDKMLSNIPDAIRWDNYLQHREDIISIQNVER